MLPEKKQDSDQTKTAFASLTAGLLARKGEAHPAPAHLDGVSLHAHGTPEFAKASQTATAPSDPPVPAPAAQPTRPHALPSRQVKGAGQGDTLPHPNGKALRGQAPAPRPEGAEDEGCCKWSLPDSAMKPLPPGQRHSVGLRIDDERLHKVKILAARAGSSNQKVLLAALDHYLEATIAQLSRECPCLARSFQDDK